MIGSILDFDRILSLNSGYLKLNNSSSRFQFLGIAHRHSKQWTAALIDCDYYDQDC